MDHMFHFSWMVQSKGKKNVERENWFLFNEINLVILFKPNIKFYEKLKYNFKRLNITLKQVSMIFGN